MVLMQMATFVDSLMDTKLIHSPIMRTLTKQTGFHMQYVYRLAQINMIKQSVVLEQQMYLQMQANVPHNPNPFRRSILWDFIVCLIKTH